MNKYEALEFIGNRLVEIDTEIVDDDEITSDNLLFNEKWLLLEAQSRIIAEEDPSHVLKMVLEI